MADIFYEDDANLEILAGKTVAIIGYGNQGRAQAMNLRDSGVDVIVGNRDDEYAGTARNDGFRVSDIAATADQGDILSITIPDEIQPDIFRDAILPRIRPNQVINFSHGYNIRYRNIELPEDVDVTLVALKTTFTEETELDLFSEQAVWPAFIRILTLSFELLTDAGYQPEAVLTELYASGEAARVFQKIVDVGLFHQMNFHSQTSQYGTLTRSERVIPDAFVEVLRESLVEIRDNSFAEEWEREKENGYPVFDKLKRQAFHHEINSVEKELPNKK